MRLIGSLGREGAICTNSGCERQVLRALAEALPGRADALRAIESRLFDLLPVVRNGYHHPGFRGSFSLKSMLPVLVPDMGYDDLPIADGQTATVRYACALAHPGTRVRQRTFADPGPFLCRQSVNVPTAVDRVCDRACLFTGSGGQPHAGLKATAFSR